MIKHVNGNIMIELWKKVHSEFKYVMQECEEQKYGNGIECKNSKWKYSGLKDFPGFTIFKPT